MDYKDFLHNLRENPNGDDVGAYGNTPSNRSEVKEPLAEIAEENNKSD